MFVLWTYLAAIHYLSIFCHAFDCLGPNGQAVDWFIVYKLPELPKSPSKILQSGLGFYYLDDSHQMWSLSNVGMKDKTGNPVYHTLQQIYSTKDNETFLSAMYNDQPPNRSQSLNHGHTKGVFAFEKTGGFWLISSIPEFPFSRTLGYGFPESAEVYGQSMLCISLPYDSVESLANIMLFTYPKLYDKNFPQSFALSNPQMAKILQNTQSHVMSPPFVQRTVLSSKQGREFFNYAKAGGFEADLYDSFVVCNLKSTLFVETWQHGASKNQLSSNCSLGCAGPADKVYNIKRMQFKAGIFKETKDHSKWALSTDGKWICIGDINRQKTQFHRGGSTTCFQSGKTWMAFNQTIAGFQNC